MAVDAVGADVERAVLVPLDGDVVGRVGGVLDLGVGLDPVDALADLAPEPVGVLDRALVHRQVLLVVDPGAARPLGGYVVDLVRHRARSSRGRHRVASIIGSRARWATARWSNDGARFLVVPVLVTGIQRATHAGACRLLDPVHKARDDKVGPADGFVRRRNEIGLRSRTAARTGFSACAARIGASGLDLRRRLLRLALAQLELVGDAVGGGHHQLAVVPGPLRQLLALPLHLHRHHRARLQVDDRPRARPPRGLSHRRRAGVEAQHGDAGERRLLDVPFENARLALAHHFEVDLADVETHR